jgi:hypothetical protein
MRVFRAGSGGHLPPATDLYTFAAWTPTLPPRDLIDDRRDLLADTLTALFGSPSMTTVPRLEQIAQAFHAATLALTADSNVTGVTLTYQ